MAVSGVVKARRIDVSVAREIHKGSKVISQGDKKTRLIFDAANGRSDCNFAISQVPLNDRKWTELKVSIGKHETKVYANVNSLVTRLGLNRAEIDEAIKYHTLDNLVSQRVKTRLAEIAAEKLEVHPAVKTASYSVSSFIDRIKGALVDAWWAFTTGAWDLFRFRFMLGASDEKLQQEGQLRALTAFHNAYERVPAYKQYVDARSSNLPQNFAEIPQTSKKEYIQTARSDKDLHLDGKLPETGQIDSTTGTTGEPVIWMRSARELEMTKRLMAFAKRAKFGNENIVVINTFALGLWATGVTLAGAGPEDGLTANVGMSPDYVEKTLSLVKKIALNHPDRAIVLCGYPPNIRKIAEALYNDAQLKPLIISKKLPLHAIVGGEGMTEDLRKDIFAKGFRTVYSSYGASDLDINIGFETDTEIAIRQACLENPGLANELYSGGPPPMVFHYDPLHYYIETTDDGKLLFTCCRKERSSPRIRYNLQDSGKVMLCKDVVSLLKKYGYEITPRTNLPFLFVHGREGTVNYGGAKIHYEHLDEALRAIDTKGLVNPDRFALYKPRATDQLEFWLEAKSADAYNLLVANIHEIRKKLIGKIRERNTEFNKVLEINAVLAPEVRVFKPGESPMSIYAKLNPQRKLQRVVYEEEDVLKRLSS